MRRRLLISLVLGVLLVVVQLFLAAGIGAALLTGAIAVVVAFLVLTFSDRWFNNQR